MKDVKLFSSKSGIFSRREIEKKKLAQKKKFEKIQKDLKRRYKEEEKKRKILNKIRAKDKKDIIKLKKKQAKQLEEKRKKKILESKTRTQEIKQQKAKTKIKEIKTLKTQKSKEIITNHIPTLEKKSNRKPQTPIHHPLPKPSVQELEILLLKISDKYDQEIIKSRKLHHELEELGLTHSGLKEIKDETPSKRKKRVKKINIIHKELIKTLDNNKQTEKEIEHLHKLIQTKKKLI